MYIWEKKFLSWTNQLMGSPGECGAVCPMELYFVFWSGGLRSTSHSFHPACHLSAALWGERSCVGSSHWKRLGALGCNGSLGWVVVLSCRRAAIFGFPVLILNQVPLRARIQDKLHLVSVAGSGTMTILELSIFVMEYLSTVLLEPRLWLQLLGPMSPLPLWIETCGHNSISLPEFYNLHSEWVVWVIALVESDITISHIQESRSSSWSGISRNNGPLRDTQHKAHSRTMHILCFSIPEDCGFFPG